MRIDRILIGGAVVLGVAATGWAQQRTNPTNPNPANPGLRAGAGAQPNILVQEPNNGTNNVSTTVFVRATQVVGMEVRESTGQARIGMIADLLLTPNSNLPIASPAATSAGVGVANPNPTTPAPGASPGVGASAAPNIATAPVGGSNTSAWWQSDNDVRFAMIQIDNATADRVIVVPWDLLQFQGAYFVLGIPEARMAEAPSVMMNDPRILQSSQWLDQVGTFFANDLQQIRSQTGVPAETGAGLGVTPVPNATTPTTPNPERPASRTTRRGGAARP